MMVKVRPLGRLPLIRETVTYLERRARGEDVGYLPNAKQIEERYLDTAPPLREILLTLARAWGDQPALRQILFFHYLQQEPLFKQVLQSCVYPQFDHKVYLWNEPAIKRFLGTNGLTESEQNRSVKIIEKALAEMKYLSGQQSMMRLEYQRPAVESVAYAFYAEYSDGFPEGRRFSLMNPPLEQIIGYAAFPAYFLMDPRSVPMALEACRMKNYISLEARGGLCQYALIYQDLFGLVEYMAQGGRL